MAIRAGIGSRTPIRGRTLAVGIAVRARRARRVVDDLVSGVDVAGDDVRHSRALLGEAIRVVQQHFCVAAVGAADEQDDVGSGLA